MSEPRIPGDHLQRMDPDPERGVEVDRQSPGERAEPLARTTFRNRLLGLFGGLLGAGLVYLLMPADLSSSAKVTAATAVLMGLWWMTEAIPIPATALVPLVVFPIFNSTTDEDGTVSKVSLDDVGASYGNNIIFLFMGGFLIALAMQRWNLHRRIALLTVRAMGTSPSMVIAGFMIATAFVSMWVSNTATAVMMLPIGVSVLLLVARLRDEVPGDLESDSGHVDEQSQDVKDHLTSSNFGTALMLGIAYAASIGSLATIIGTPPNTLLVGYLSENHDITIGFGQWMVVGLPLAIVFLVICWALLTKVLYKPEITEIPGGRELMDDEIDKLGPMATGEKRVLALFVLAAASWVTLPLIFDEPFISDAGIAVAVGLLLFLTPSGTGRGVRLLDWASAVELPWGVLLLFGGGLALSAQFGSSGLTKWIGSQAESLGGAPAVFVVVVLVAVVIFLTELTSNTATAATFLPVVGGIALGLDLPVLLVTIPVAIAASCAFMLPVATPPNAIAYGSGYVAIPQMVKAGIWLNLIGIVLVTLTAMTLATWVFGIVY